MWKKYRFRAIQCVKTGKDTSQDIQFATKTAALQEFAGLPLFCVQRGNMEKSGAFRRILDKAEGWKIRRKPSGQQKFETERSRSGGNGQIHSKDV